MRTIIYRIGLSSARSKKWKFSQLEYNERIVEIVSLATEKNPDNFLAYALINIILIF